MKNLFKHMYDQWLLQLHLSKHPIAVYLYRQVTVAAAVPVIVFPAQKGGFCVLLTGDYRSRELIHRITGHAHAAKTSLKYLGFITHGASQKTQF